MLHHVEIYVENLEETKAFYNRLFPLLGYEEYQKWDKGISYIYDGTYIVFVQTEDKYLEYPYHRKHSGLNHLAFSVESDDMVDRVREVMLENGVTELYAHQFPTASGSYYAFYFEDNNRMKLEVISRG